MLRKSGAGKQHHSTHFELEAEVLHYVGALGIYHGVWKMKSLRIMFVAELAGNFGAKFYQLVGCWVIGTLWSSRSCECTSWVYARGR